MKTIFKGNRFKVTSGYRTADRTDHHGIDLVGLDSDVVVSPIEGTVMVSTIITDKNNLTWEWGNYVRVDDKEGNRYHFCHLDRRLVGAGQKVNVGTELGIMGNTGYSFGKHTHFEIRKADNKTRIDPAEFLGVPNKIGEYSVLPDKEKAPFVVGETVTFTGTKHYVSSNSVNGKACKPGKAKVTALAGEGRHPVHLVALPGKGSNVYGWVDTAFITRENATLTVGAKVKVNPGAKTYTGGKLAPFVYNSTYDVIKIQGNRVVIGLGKAVTAAMNKKDLTVV